MAMNLQNVNNNVPQKNVKTLLGSDKVKKRFNEMFKDPQKSAQFLASVSSAVASTPMLQKCDANEVLVCAGIAASLNLDVNPNLGFSAIIPFNKSTNVNGQWVKTPHPQFQIMTKGYIQMAQRTGQYTALNVTEVYADELLGVNYITGKVNFDEKGGEQRKLGKKEDIVGYCAYMKLVNGFEHFEYWTSEKIEAHAKKYSMSYQNDIKYNSKKSLWSTDFPAMAKKTVIKAMLKQWGVLSTQLQKAIIADNATDVKDGNYSYGEELPVVGKTETEHKDELEEQLPQSEFETDPSMQQPQEYSNEDIDNVDFGDTGL